MQSRSKAELHFLNRIEQDFGDYFFAALIFAHRAFCAAATRARPAVLIPRLFGFSAGVEAEAPRIADNFLSSLVIFSLRLAARRSCAGVNDDNVLLIAGVL